MKNLLDRHPKGAQGGKGGQFRSRPRAKGKPSQSLSLQPNGFALLNLWGETRELNKMTDGKWQAETSGSLFSDSFASKLMNVLHGTPNEKADLAASVVADMLNDKDISPNYDHLQHAAYFAMRTAYEFSGYELSKPPDDGLDYINGDARLWLVRCSASMRGHQKTKAIYGVGHSASSRIGLEQNLILAERGGKDLFCYPEPPKPYLGADGLLLYRLASVSYDPEERTVFDYLMGQRIAGKQVKPLTVWWMTMYLMAETSFHDPIRDRLIHILDSCSTFFGSGWNELGRLMKNEKEWPEGAQRATKAVQSILNHSKYSLVRDVNEQINKGVLPPV